MANGEDIHPVRQTVLGNYLRAECMMPKTASDFYTQIQQFYAEFSKCSFYAIKTTTVPLKYKLMHLADLQVNKKFQVHTWDT